MTCTADHSPDPRAVGIQRALSPSAMARSDVAPAACSSAMTGARSDARFADQAWLLCCEAFFVSLNLATVSRGQAAAGNGIFAAGDRRPKTCLRDETYAQRHTRDASRPRKTGRK
jgi:hypothetical protein